jgi:hypothetical protein
MLAAKIPRRKLCPAKGTFQGSRGWINGVSLIICVVETVAGIMYNPQVLLKSILPEECAIINFSQPTFFKIAK